MQILKKISITLIKNWSRILIYELIVCISCYVLLNNTQEVEFNKKEILNILISIIAIIVAIIVTYLFSKLFAEKTIRIERKKEIDELSLKITLLRRMAHQIRINHEFWQFGDINVKSSIDYNYPNLSYEEYRGYDIIGIKKYTYDEIIIIDENIYGSTGQAYLALKGLEDNEDSFSFYSEINPKNYSLNDIARYKDYANAFWYMLDKSDNSTVNFDGINSYWLNIISELYSKIKGKRIDDKNYKSQIKDLFAEFEEIYFNKHYYLTSLNSDIFPSTFMNSFINMLIFVFILIVSLFIYIINLSQLTSQLITILLISIFIANTVDLVLLTYKSIKGELKIDDVFKL